MQGLNTVVSVGTSTTSVLPSNYGRSQMTLINTGANQISVSLGLAAAVAGSGIVLAAGASYTDNGWVGAVQAIALTGATNLAVSEY